MENTFKYSKWSKSMLKKGSRILICTFADGTRTVGLVKGDVSEEQIHRSDYTHYAFRVKTLK